MRYEIEGKLLSDIGDAIREKTGKSELILPGDMPGEIEEIKSNTDDWVLLKNYIQSDGSQYIDTKYICNDNTMIEVVANISSVNRYACLFGARNGDYTATKRIMIGRSSNSQLCFYTGIDTPKMGVPESKCFGSKSRYILSKYNGGVYNSNYIYYSSISLNDSQIDDIHTLYLLGLNQGNGASTPATMCAAKLYRCRLYNGSVLVHEFIPWQENGVACLKDTVSNDLLHNAGHGDFVYGTDV